MTYASVSSLARALVVAGAVAALASAGLSGQTASELPGAAAAKGIVEFAMAKGYTPPKTPWGHPDIQGVFTTKDEANTPFERPEEWAGRRMEDITPKELAEAVAKRQQAATESAPFAGGGEVEEGVAIAVPIHWFDNLAAMNSRPWFVIDPSDGKVPPLAPEAATRQFARGRNGGGRDSYTDRNLNDRCVAMTWRQPTLYGNSYQIVQTPDHVILRREQIHEAQVIPLDGRPHVNSSIRTYEGDARGHWEGNTLVVVTKNFALNVPLRAGIRRGGFGRAEQKPSPSLTVIERFTRIAPNKVEWTVTYDDPGTWTRPWTYSMPLTQDATQMIHEYACHEGNYGLANILSAGRSADEGGK